MGEVDGGHVGRPGNLATQGAWAQVGKCHMLSSAGRWTLCFLLKGSISMWKTVPWNVKIIPF